MRDGSSGAVKLSNEGGIIGNEEAVVFGATCCCCAGVREKLSCDEEEVDRSA